MNDANRLSLRQLRCFVTVADELHFRRAAERLHVSQPPLTQRIQDMERDLGVELFRRIGNKGELTDAGRMVLKGARMKASLGPVYIENRGGAGGLVGGDAVAHANSDGYTLLLGSVGTQVVIPSASGTAPYDPDKDFEPISILLTSSLAIVVHPGLPARTLKELVAYAKANPGTLSYGSTGAGSTSQLAGELFKSLTGTRIVSAPYKGAGPMISDVIRGHIPLTMVNVTGQLIDLHRSGKVRLLAMTSTSRLAAAPDEPRPRQDCPE